nr:hypothetical protein CFP56_45905 [Quercus suber]
MLDQLEDDKLSYVEGITFSSLEDSVVKALSPPRLNPSKANHAKPSLIDCNLRLQNEISRIWMKHGERFLEEITALQQKGAQLMEENQRLKQLI